MADVTPAEQNSVAFTININTLVDDWSTDTNTKSQSKCSLREAPQATVSGNPQCNQGCGAASIANFTDYDIVMPGGTYLLTRNEQLPNITKKIVIDGKGAVTIDGNGKSNRAEGIFIVGSGELILSKLKLWAAQSRPCNRTTPIPLPCHPLIPSLARPAISPLQC